MWWGPGADPGEEPPPQQQEEQDLKDQFQQQQDKITQMKEMLKSSEQKLVAKGKEVEQYATKLSAIQSRSKASKRRGGLQKQEPSEGRVNVQEPVTPKEGIPKDEATTPGRSGGEKTRQGNLVLLRKQLEENRLKFEQRGKEISENKKGIEEMVQQLKMQLDERDITIQKLQKGLEAHQSPHLVRNALLQETIENMTSVPELSNQTQQELYTQIVYKDNKIIELNNKIVELETTILDLQENFREKDSVIDARTKAIALMSEDFSRRNKTTLDNLEETREEMRKMQNNFVIQEVKLKEEIDRLKKEFATKNHRLLQLEESNKNLESVRFDLSTRNAELQEKMVKIQEQCSRQQKQVDQLQQKDEVEKAQESTKVGDLVRQLDEANKQMTKMKAQYKTKVKNLNKQLEDLKKMSDANEEIVKLQNRIAELEEDKGNLQLHLVDFDELKVSESHWQTRVAELEERVLQQSQDLDSHVHMITLLESEKFDQIQRLQTEKEKISVLEAEIGKLKSSISELENQKVSLEMKTVDLEEQVDILTKEKIELQEEMEALSHLNEAVEEHASKLDQPPLADADVNNGFQNLELVERSKDQKQLSTQEFNVTEGIESQNQKSLKELQAELERSNRIIEEQREIIMDLSSKIDSREEELEMQHEIIAKLEQLGEEYKDDRISEIVKELTEVASDLEEWKKRCREVEKRLQDLGDEKTELENRFKEVKSENTKLNQKLEEQKEIATDLAVKLREQSNAIVGRDERISSLQSLIEMNGQTLEAREMTLKDVHEKLNSVEKQYESKYLDLKLSLTDKEKELSEATLELAKQDNIIKDKETQIMKLGEALQKQQMALKGVHDELSNVEKVYESRCLELKSIFASKEEELSEIKSKLTKQNDIVKDKEKEIFKLSECLEIQSHELALLKQQVSAEESNIQQSQVRLEDMSKTVVEKDQLNDELTFECQQYRQQLEKLNFELAVKTRDLSNLEMKMEEFTQHESKQKSDLIFELNSRDNELSSLTQELASKHHEFEDRMVKMKEVEQKVAELTEKNKKLIANLKAKVIAIKGYEQKLLQYEEVVKAKELLIADITSKNEELLNEEQSKTDLISEELNKATNKIVNLESELKMSQSKIEELILLEEANNALKNKVSELEREIGLFQIEIRNKDNQINLLEEEKVRNSEEEKGLKLKDEDDVKRNLDQQKVLKEKIEALEVELAQERSEITKLRMEKDELGQQISILSDSSKKVGHLSEEIKNKEQKIIELEEQLTSVVEKNQASLSAVQTLLQEREVTVHSLEQELHKATERVQLMEEQLTSVTEKDQQSMSAIEAKVQEREAVVESLEQELFKTSERVQHLEERLAYVEERRHSLESKAEALNLQLRESDRMKEEVVENEGMLEQQLQTLIANEDTLKKKLDALNRENEELTQKVAEVTIENSELKKEIVNMEIGLKGLQKELERLSPFEYSFTRASEKIESLEAELKRVVVELEHRMKEKVSEVRQHAENLESDLRNVNLQLEQVELERRTVMERYEKLNDEKLNLEDEVDGLNQTVAIYKSTNEDLKKELQEKVSALEASLSEKELARKDLEERVQFLEDELQEKTLAYEEKEYITSEQNKKIELLEEEVKVVSSASSLVEVSLLEKEQLQRKLNEQIHFLEKELENRLSSFKFTSVEKEKIINDLQSRLQSQETELERNKELLEERIGKTSIDSEINVSASVSEDHVASLNLELNDLKSLLSQKDTEIKNYQTRLLQLQFGNVPDIAPVPEQDSQGILKNKISQLEECDLKLQETVKAKEVEISNLTQDLISSNEEIEHMRSELISCQERIEELMEQINQLQEETMNKSNHIQQLKVTLADLPSEVNSVKQEYESRVLALEQESVEQYHELVKLRAQQEVSQIVRVAETLVDRINLTSEASYINDFKKRSKPVQEFQEPVQDQTVFTEDAHQQTEFTQELEEQLKLLESEIRVIKTERDVALIRIRELEGNGTSAGDTIIMFEDDDERLPSLQDNIDGIQQHSESSLDKSEPVTYEDVTTSTIQQEQSLAVPEPVINFGSSSWDVVEEGWGWGSDEARLEEEHLQKQQQALSYSEPSGVLHERIVTLENYIKDIEVEKERLSEELHASQVRSGKMLKKMKDLKLKNDNLMKENLELAKKKSESNFGDLDQAIEEELKIRIDSLEKELKELKTERDTAQTEKEGLVKRIDMLINANERFVEMKERQDFDMEVWKQKNRDLSNQVQSLEWKIGELMEVKAMGDTDTKESNGEKETFFSWDKRGFTHEIESTNKELQDQITALSTDNENLQVLLEEQRSLRLGAEAELKEMHHRLLANTEQQSSAEMGHLLEENTRLKEQLDQLYHSTQNVSQLNSNHELQQECERLVGESMNFQNAYHVLKEEYNRVCKESEEYVNAAEKKYEKLQLDLANKIDDVCNEKIKVEEQCRNILKDRSILNEELQKLSDNMGNLKQQYDSLKSEYNTVKEQLNMQEKSLVFSDEQKLRLEYELIQLKSQMGDSSSISGTAELLSEQQARIFELEMELRAKTDEVETLRQLIESQKLEQAKVEQEWNGKMERLRREMEFNAEDLFKQQDRHSILIKEHEELKTSINEMIQCRIQEALGVKEEEIGILKAKLAEEEAQFVLQSELKTEQLLHNREEDIEALKQKLEESTMTVSAKDKDIEQLMLKLTEKEKEIQETVYIKNADIQNLKIQLSDNENKFVELLGHKDQDIYNLQVQLSEKDARINELQHMLDEEARQLTELRALLEDRELQLSQLKDEFETSRGDDPNVSRSIQLLPTSSNLAQDSTYSSSLSEKPSSEGGDLGRRRNDSSSADSQQGELDLALYMLHQRDVRCDELTLELMQLLEERDSLQLRLSNALRLNEELRNKSRSSPTSSPLKTIAAAASQTVSSISIEESPQHVIAAVPLQSVATTMDQPQEDLQALANKLSQLRSVGYRRDVTLQDEREQRHSDQMRLLHHRGSGIVVDASYTLSRDVQSPSTVLLNWIWGRSTPRVMHV